MLRKMEQKSTLRGSMIITDIDYHLSLHWYTTLGFTIPNILLRVPVHKNGKWLGKGQKFDFTHIFMVDRLERDKNYWIVLLAKYPFISKKYANYQIPLKSSFNTPFYYTSLRASHTKPHHSSVLKTLKYFCACLNVYWVDFRECCVVFLGAK